MESFLREGVDIPGMSSRVAGDAHFFEDATSPDKIRSYLDSTKEADKLKGMKWLLAMLSKGRDVSEFFADVVKNVVVKSIEVKKMVYNYLVHYADYDATCREIALLSINSFQKDMSGGNQLIRGVALRVMTSIRVADIIQIQLLAVRKCATDSSPYVRKCAATAIPKIYSVDPEQLGSLKQILEKLLKDSSTMVMGSAVAAYNEVCPTSYELIHRCYRKICHLLADMDEWTQVSVLDVMTRYVRNQFTDPAPGVAAASRLQAKQRSTAAVKGNIGTTVKRRIVKKAFYSDEEDESAEEDIEVDVKPEAGSVFTGAEADNEGDLDADHRFLLRSSIPLLKSRNSGVVLGVCALHYYCGTQSAQTTQQIAKALVRILRNRREIQYIVLTAINTMAQQRPAMFTPFISDFFVKGSDPVFNRLLKLEIMTSVCAKENIQSILRELQIYVKHGNQDFVCASIRAVGRIADADPDVAGKCMEGLVHLMLCNKAEGVVGETVVVLRQILQQNSSSEAGDKVLHQLVKMLIGEQPIEVPLARSSIVWLVGEFHEPLAKVAPDILRILAAGFVDESTETKTQVMNLAIKLGLRVPDDDNVQNLMTYILEMSRYDLDTDLRDRSRFMTALMGLAPSNDDAEGGGGGGGGGGNAIDEDALEELSEHAQGILLAPKLPPVTLLGSVDVEGLPNFTVGSLSSMVGHYVNGYHPLAGWPDVQPDPNVRDTLRLGGSSDASDFLKSAGGGGGSGKNNKGKGGGGSDDEGGGGHDLKGFYGEKSDGSSDGSSSSGSDSDTSSDSSDSDSSSSSDSDDSDSDGSDSDSDKSSKESDSSSESEEEEVTRIPITQLKTQGGLTKSVRKVATTGGRMKKSDLDVFSSDPLDFTHTPTSGVESGLASLSLMSSAAPPGAAAAASVEFGDDFSTLFPSAVNLDASSLAPQQSFGTAVAAPAVAAHHDPVLAAVMSVPLVPSQQQQQLQQQQQMDPFSGMIPNLQGNAPPLQPMLAAQFPQQQQPMMGFGVGIPQQQSPMMGGGMMPRGPMGGFNPGMQGIGMQQQRLPGLQPVALIVEDLSEPKIVLKPEIGGGLAVSLVFRYGVQAVAYAGAHSAYISVQNNRDHIIRRVKISFPADIRRTQVEDIAQLAPGQEVRLPLEIVLSGLAGKQIRIDVRNDVGAFVGTYTPEGWEVLFPLTISPFDFDTIRRRLTGFCEASKSFPLASIGITSPGGGGPAAAAEAELVARVKKMLNVFVVQGAGVGELMFAGCSRKGMMEEKVLITITTDSEQATLRFNCEDAVLATSLVEAFKRNFSKYSSSSSPFSLL